METYEVLDIMYLTLQTAVRLSMPFLLVSLIAGLVIAVFQAATQINEQTLTFVPKLLLIIAVMGVLGSTMLDTLQSFFRQMVMYIAAGG